MERPLKNNEKERNSEFKEIDLFDPLLEKQFTENGQIFERKTDTPLLCREVNDLEEVITYTEDGLVESVRKAEKGDLIVTGSKGEEYVIKQDRVAVLYDKHTDDSYVPKNVE